MLEKLKSQNKVIGLKQTQRAVSEDRALIVFIAKDADKRITAPIISQCEKSATEIILVYSMAVLGEAVGIEVGAAFVTVLNNSF